MVRGDLPRRSTVYYGEADQGRERCEVEEVGLGCGAVCASQICEGKIQERDENQSAESVLLTDRSRGGDGRVAGG